MENFENIFKLVTGNLARDEKEKVLSEIEARKENQEIFRKSKIAWAFFCSGKQLSDYDEENLYLKIKDGISGKKVRLLPSIKMASKYAAIIVFVVSLTFYYSTKHHLKRSGVGEELSFTSFITENGQRSKVVLPDSSIVWLNSGTVLSYPSNFTTEHREVSVKGQAFFQVHHDEENPFLVEANGLKVKALGTEFDVDAYPENEEIVVVLESGKVELTHKNYETFSYMMEPGEKAAFRLSEHNSMNISNVETAVYSSWKDGKLIFRNSSMKEVVEKLQKWYDINVNVVDSEVYNSIFSGTIKNESYEEIFRLIGIACQVECSIKYDNNIEGKPQIIISRK